MKHLHFRFIIASLALGLGFLNLMMVFFEARMLSMATTQVARLWLLAGIFLAGGATMVCYGWNEIQAEMIHHRKRS
jgi:hypothetical protein